MKIKNLANREAEVYLFDEIGMWGDSASSVVDQLRGIDADHIQVRINSPGGDVFDGIAIMNVLKTHPARITTVVEGLAASAASFIAVGAGDECVMMPHSQIMIHDAWGFTAGNADELARIADQLNKASNELAAIYAAKAGGSVEDWRAAMREESWFTAEEAVEAGLADRVHEHADNSRALAAVGGFTMLNRFHSRGRVQRPTILDKRKEQPMSLHDEVARRVGVENTIDDAVLLAALDEALGEVTPVENDRVAELEKEAEALREEAEALRAELEKKREVAEDETITEVKNSLTVTVDADRYNELVEQAAYAKAAREREDVRRHAELVDAAISVGKISAGARDKWLAALRTDDAHTTEIINQLPAGAVPRHEIGHGQSVEVSVEDAEAVERRSRIAAFMPKPKL